MKKGYKWHLNMFYFLYLVMYNSPNAVLAKDGEKDEACFGFHVVNILMREMFPKIWSETDILVWIMAWCHQTSLFRKHVYHRVCACWVHSWDAVFRVSSSAYERTVLCFDIQFSGSVQHEKEQSSVLTYCFQDQYNTVLCFDSWG